jgi:hypothetical protein
VTTVGELRQGAAFRAADGTLWAVAFRFPDRTVRCYSSAGDPGKFWDAEPGTIIEPLDLPALLAEHALFRRLLADAGQDQGYAVGAWAEREAVLRLLEVYANEAEGERSVHVIGSGRWQAASERLALARCLLEDVRARGVTGGGDA